MLPGRVALLANVKFKTESGSLSVHSFVRLQKLALSSFDHYAIFTTTLQSRKLVLIRVCRFV
jgi:hypothetical protein